MNKRIRYSRQANDSYVSMKVIKSGSGEDYRAFIDPSGKAGFVSAYSDPDLIYHVVGTSPHKVKIKIKEVLESLGCEFEKETRNVDKEENAG